MPFLPIFANEIDCQPDFVIVTGDAYVDHPSFGTAIISRVLEAEGFSVAIIPQPDYKSKHDFMRFGMFFQKIVYVVGRHQRQLKLFG